MVAPHAYVTLYDSCSPPTSLQQPDFGARRRNKRGRMVACRCKSMSADSFFMRGLHPAVLLAAQPYRVLRSHPTLSERCAFAPGHLCAASANTGGAHQLCILNYRIRHNSQVSSGNTMYLWHNPSCLPARSPRSTALPPNPTAPPIQWQGLEACNEQQSRIESTLILMRRSRCRA